jgi:DNA-binding transcriptional MerR regulator
MVDGMDGGWTLSELSAQVAGVLGDGSPGQVSGRVREVPDERTIRWYTTIGLVDRPSGMRGRTALYGRRHMLQLVAIKRLQAQGLSLAGIQARLFGATDDELANPEPANSAAPAVTGSPAHTAAPARTRFWAAAAAGDAAVPGSLSSPPGPAAPPHRRQPVPVFGIELAGGVTLLLGAHQPDAAGLAEIADAARPLLDTLRRLHLVSSSKGNS